MTTRLIQKTLRETRLVALFLAVISIGISLLMLASPVYMLQVFDRVLQGRSLETLLLLSLAVVFALMVMGSLDACRAVILARLGDWLEKRLNGPVMSATLETIARPAAQITEQPLSDLASIRQFLSSAGVGALFDAPLMPLFIAVIWLIHPVLGMVALGSAILLALLALASDLLTRGATRKTSFATVASDALKSGTVSHAETAQTMGLTSGLSSHWKKLRDQTTGHLLTATVLVGVIGASSKAVRLAVQAAILGFGAYLVLDRAITPGQMIACSIILSRALAPLETAIGSWRQFVAARQAWQRIVGLLLHHGAKPRGLELPAPKGQLSCERVTLVRPGVKEPIVQGVSFDIPPGSSLGIIGPSGSGKSSLARLITRAWQPSDGTIRLDSADIGQWQAEALGRHVGYLPQGAELFPGSIRDNISRFHPHELDDVVSAAQRARAHEVIVGLPAGYEAQVGINGDRLSGGQRQRIALARALFGQPCMVVLDEPDANLDQAGHDALMQTLADLRQAGVTLVIVAHRQKILAACDYLLMMENGRATAFGPARDVIERLKHGKGPAHLHAVQGTREQT